MPDNIVLTIDGQSVEVPPGTMIVEAAKKLGIEIPTFCYDNRLRSVGACRMCLVEVEKSPKLVASCATPVAPNMVIRTASEKVLKARKGVLEFLLINHPLDCPTCDKGGECPLQNLTYDHGQTGSRYKEDKIRFIADINQKFDDKQLGPEILLCRNRCIMCFKCVRIVRELAGEADLGVFNRGAFANIGVLDELAFADEYSGNTVENCPVGALTSKSFRYKIRNWLLKKTTSVCDLCSVGCNISIEWSGGKVYRQMARPNGAVDSGWLCDRGRYGFDLYGSENRLTKAYLHRDQKLELAGWNEALMLISKHLRKIIDGNRGAEVAAVGSPSLSNEEAYAARRFFDEVIKTSDLDFQAFTSNPIEPELLNMVGLSGNIADLERDKIFIFVGYDPAIEHPVMSLRIRKAISQHGARAIFIGSYDKRLGNFPVTNVRIPFGTEGFAIEYILSKLTNTNSEANNVNLNNVKLDEIAELLKGATGIHIMAGKDFLAHHDRKALLGQLLKLKNAANGKFSILPAGANFIGVSHFGLYGELEHSFNKILKQIDSGDIRTLFVFGSNPVDEYPDRKYVQDILKKLEFLVVVAPFMHSTAQMASVVLPQAMLPDFGGTFVNIEGRIQQFCATGEKKSGDSRPIWSILGELSDSLGLGTVWYHDSQIRQDMAQNLKGLEMMNSIPEGGLLFKFTDQNDNAIDAPELSKPLGRNSELPYSLSFSDTAIHSGWLTHESENLNRISNKCEVLMNPADADSEGVVDGQMIEIGAEATTICAAVKISDKVNRRELLLLNPDPKENSNKLMNKNKPATYVLVRKS